MIEKSTMRENLTMQQLMSATMGNNSNKLTNKLKILTKLFREVEKVDD